MGKQAFLRGAVLVALLACGLAGAAWAQEAVPAAPDAVQRELQAIEDLLVRAIAEFDGAQQSRSIVILDEIITRLESLRRDRTLPPRGREVLAQAYELRGRAYYNIGLQENRNATPGMSPPVGSMSAGGTPTSWRTPHE